MGRASTDLIDPETLAELDRRLVSRRCAVMEVVEQMRSEGFDIRLSKSAAYRRTKRMDEIAKELRSKREVADAIARNLTDAPERDVSQVVVEQTHAMLFDIMSADVEDLDADERIKLAVRVSQAISNLAMASKHHADTVLKIRSQAAKEAAKAAESTMREAGISDETVEAVRRRILGIKEAA